MPPWVEQHLDEGARTLMNQGLRTEIRVRCGQVVEEILAEASEGEYDIIVVGGHLTGRSVRAQEQDLANEILARADRPVLIVRDRTND